MKVNKKTLILYMFLILTESAFSNFNWNEDAPLKSINELDTEYEDEKNAMIAIRDKVDKTMYEDFYEDMDNRIEVGQSMNVIFFGPSSSFLRLDTETLLHILQFTTKHRIPITRAIIAWDMVTDGKTAAYLQGRVFLAFGSLINVIPEEDLHYVNFGDPSVLKFFSNVEVDLHPRKVGILATAYRRYFGNEWYTKGAHINELGYLLCGFAEHELEKIPPEIIKDISPETFKKMKKCSPKQLQAVYNIAIQPKAYGIPYLWNAHEIERLGQLFNCIPKEDIGELQLGATSAITYDVLVEMDMNKLEYFSKQQVLNMMPRTRRIYILRMQLQTSYDMDNVSARSSVLKEYCYIYIFVFLFECIVRLLLINSSL